MFSGKVIKSLCYIVIGVILIVSCFLLCMGILSLVDDDSLGVAWIVLGLVLPFMTTVSMYPIFALASIDENLAEINQKIECFVSDRSTSRAAPNMPLCAAQSPLNQKLPTSNKPLDLVVHSQRSGDAVSFVNQKYGISILPEDDLATIQEKISSIQDGGFSVIILKRKVMEAGSKEEVDNIFVMHQVAHS